MQVAMGSEWKECDMDVLQMIEVQTCCCFLDHPGRLGGASMLVKLVLHS